MAPGVGRRGATGRVVRALLVASVCAAAALAPVGAAAQDPLADAPVPAQIDRNGVLILVRSTLLALDHANSTGNYSVLRDLAAPGFRDANNPAQLAEIFANLRAQNLDLSGVAVLDPQLTLLPQVEPGGMMRMAGFFPSIPMQINFELLYAPVDGRWRPFGIAVGVASSTPAAPRPPVIPVPDPRPDAPPEATEAEPAPAETPPADASEAPATP